MDNNSVIQSVVAMKGAVQKKTVPDAPITSIGLDLTNNCTLKCDYCFRGEKNKQKLSWQVGIKAIDFLIRYSQSQKSLKVSLFGGEPLMEFGLIKKLVPYAEQKATYYGKRIDFTATTNCVLVNDEIISFFRRHQMRFHTSIDGGPESNDKHRCFPDGTGTSAIIEPKIEKILELTESQKNEIQQGARKYAQEYLSIDKLTEKRINFWRSVAENKYR